MNSAQDKISKWQKLKQEKATTDSYMQEVADLILPSREVTFTDQEPGRKKHAKIYDTTAIWANEQFASGLHGMLTSSAIKWFMLKMRRAGIKSEAASIWLNEVTDIMYSVFNNTKGMFNTQAHEVYLELGAFGNGVMFVDRDVDGIKFRAYSIANVCYEENEAGVVDTLFRVSSTSLVNLIKRFPDTVHEKVREQAEKTPHKKVRFLHVVEPREVGEKGSYATNKPYSSCFIDIDNKHIMEEGGYDMFPYMCPRFSKRTNEVYGFGPGMSALADVKMINRMHEITIRGMEKMVDPPILVPHEAMIRPMTLQPAGMNFYDPSSGGKPEAFLTNGRPELGLEYLRDQQQKIIRHFYVDWMNLPQNSTMTATEVMQRRDERLRLLGPMLSRLQTEFLGPLIDRVFFLLVDSGLIPQPPEELSNNEIDIDYISPIAQAQKFAEMDSINRTISTALTLAEIDPAVVQNLNLDAIVRYNATEINSIPASLLTPLSEVEASRKEQQEQARAAREAETNNEQAKAVKGFASAENTVAKTEAM